MTSEGLGEVFKGYSVDTCAGKFPLVSWGDERTVKRLQTVSEDPHRRERKFHSLLLLFSVNIKPPRHRFGLSLCLGFAKQSWYKMGCAYIIDKNNLFHSFKSYKSK